MANSTRGLSTSCRQPTGRLSTYMSDAPIENEALYVTMDSVRAKAKAERNQVIGAVATRSTQAGPTLASGGPFGSPTPPFLHVSDYAIGARKHRPASNRLE